MNEIQTPTALVLTDPQNDFLSPDVRSNWGASVPLERRHAR